MLKFSDVFPLLALLVGTEACGTDSSKEPTNPDGFDGVEGNVRATTQWTRTPYPTAGLYGVWGTAANDIWAVGDNNNIVNYDGSTWSTLQSGASGRLMAVWGSDPKNVWAAGDSVMRWDGSSWTPQSVPVALSESYPINSIWGSSSDDVWMAGGSILLHWNGSVWAAPTMPTFQPANGTIPPKVAFTSGWESGVNDVWVVGEVDQYGVILHWDGNTWSTAMQGSSTVALFEMYGVWGTSSTDVWAVGNENRAHYDGNSWSLEQCPLLSTSAYAAGDTLTACQPGLLGGWSSSATDAWAIGGVTGGMREFYMYGSIEHWDGTKWTMSDSAAANGISAIWGTGPNNVWAVGASGFGTDGVILHYGP